MAGLSFGAAMDKRVQLADDTHAREWADAETRRIAALRSPAPDLAGQAALMAQKDASAAILNQRANGGGLGMAPPKPAAAVAPVAAAPGTINVNPMTDSQLATTQPLTGSILDPERKPYAKGGMVHDPQGSPTRDTVPAKLADGEAVLNAGAAEFLGSDVVQRLNQLGLKSMNKQGMTPPETKFEDGELHAAGGFSDEAGRLPWHPDYAFSAEKMRAREVDNRLGPEAAAFQRSPAYRGAVTPAAAPVAPATQQVPVTAPGAAIPPVQVVPEVKYAALPKNASQEQRSNYNLAEQGMANIVRRPGNVYTDMGAVNPNATQRFKEQGGLTGSEIQTRNKAQSDAAYADAYAKQQAGMRDMLAVTNPAAYASMYHSDQALQGTKAAAQDKAEAKQQDLATRVMIANAANQTRRDTAKMWEPETDPAGNMIGFINKGTTERKPTFQKYRDQFVLAHPEYADVDPEVLRADYNKKYGAN